MARATLQTIADHLGVSRMTVSNAFSRPDQLSKALRERILTTAEELGYAGPDPAGRALARGTTGAVGVLLTSSLHYAFTDEVATGFLAAIAEELAPTGLALTLLNSSSHSDVVPTRDVAMDGALVYSCEPDPALEWLVRRRLPLVLVDQQPAAGIPSVNIEDRLGAAAAAQHVVDLGHRRVAVMTVARRGQDGLTADPTEGPGGSLYVARERVLGFLDALDAADVESVVHGLPHSQEKGAYAESAYEATRLLLQSDPAPTAILCYSDAVAEGVVRSAQDLGLRVPEDLSVVGFDDSPLARRMRPALTTVHQDLTAKGKAAAAALTSAIAHSRNGTKGRARHLVLPATLVVRDSTAPPRPTGR